MCFKIGGSDCKKAAGNILQKQVQNKNPYVIITYDIYKSELWATLLASYLFLKGEKKG